MTLVAIISVLSFTVWKPRLVQHGVSPGTWMKYASIPIVSTLFTYFHIWGALYMTFFPLQYKGCLQIPDTNAGLGWQGIVPNKAEKMARIAVSLMTTRLLKLEEIFSRIDPAVLTEELDPVLRTTLTNIIDEIANQEEPDLWYALPASVKNEIILKAREDAPRIIKALLEDVRNNIDKVFDLTEMIVSAFVRDAGLLNHMFITCGYNELVFVRDSGAYMGGIFGCVQVVLWIYWSAGWMLPTFGLVVGTLTNWIALKMIFQPVQPVPLFGGRVVIQGLFLKRQAEVSSAYAKIVAEHLLNSRCLIPAILKGRCADSLFEMIHAHVSEGFDRNFGSASKKLLQIRKGKDGVTRCKRLVGEKLISSLPQTMRHAEKYMDSAMDLETVLRERMAAMPPEQFDRLLHPVFEEDEWKLVLLGGVLGVLVGMAQWRFLGG
eukprot:TRINITY_DN41849_c0_g1_i1.p1 TRINITY_DN41849_c0_g1~~TRINITY_DN41849_c0_g1_i1.p1  ORF type:complete len:447 (+),score=63.29 TRINITY_DN41849_c0_g1_i1:42-1343(+)